MAMMDNAGFLLAHIRNSFITSDDTGMCELIIENDETDRESKKVSRYDMQNIKICLIFLIILLRSLASLKFCALCAGYCALPS